MIEVEVEVSEDGSVRTVVYDFYPPDERGIDRYDGLFEPTQDFGITEQL